MKHGRAQNLKTLFVPGSLMALSVFVFALNSSSASAEVYKWTDENGVTHYSQTPPPDGQEAEIQDLPESHEGVNPNPGTEASQIGSEGEELSTADLRRQELADSRKARAEEQAATEALCLDTEQLLAQLEPSRRVFYTNEDGETVRMDDEKRVAEVQRLKDIQSDHCQ